MELTNLSSNWKKLQGTLQSRGEIGGPAKRKAGDEQEATSSKKRKLSVSIGARPARRDTKSIQSRADRRKPPTTAATRMGFASSKPATPTTDHHNADVSTASALLEDIPFAQRLSSSALVRDSVHDPADTVNSGIVRTAAVGKYIALDCEMVGVGPSPSSTTSMLARVSMVNYHGLQVYDSFVLPKEAVTDYRTHVSGITPVLLASTSARPFETVQADVAQLLQGRVLVGHAVRNDLEALMLGHPKRDIRDTSRHKRYREIVGGRTPGLKRLAREVLGLEIQAGAHSSIEDARATMMLYRREKDEFEREHVRRFGVDRRVVKPSEVIEGEMLAAKGKQTGGTSTKAKNKKKRRRR